jgi:N-acetylglucosamine-6-sulfatase
MQILSGRCSGARHALRTSALLAALVLAAGVARARPNIVFIMSDDHCSQAIGAYGGRLAKLDPTPVIDTLARDGMLFENCFVTNSICTPSRACIITGQYNHVNGVLTLGGRIPPERQYLAIEMRKAGYQTAMVGKWHLKEEPNFDYYKVLPGQGKYHDPLVPRQDRRQVASERSEDEGPLVGLHPRHGPRVDEAPRPRPAILPDVPLQGAA